jgi:ActR/RegA family two-component response regulator
MKILIVGGDDALLSSLTEELESRDFQVLTTHSEDGGLSLFKKNGPFAFALADYRFVPGVNIKTCMQWVTAIHLINPFQQMAIMTADLQEVREKLPQELQHVAVLRKPFRVEQLLRLLRQPVLPLN